MAFWQDPATACQCHKAAHFGVLVCSLLATLPLCFTNQHTRIELLSKRIGKAAVCPQRGVALQEAILCVCFRQNRSFKSPELGFYDGPLPAEAV